VAASLRQIHLMKEWIYQMYVSIQVAPVALLQVAPVAQVALLALQVALPVPPVPLVPRQVLQVAPVALPVPPVPHQVVNLVSGCLHIKSDRLAVVGIQQRQRYWLLV
jgi:hypothetical protein